MPFNHLILCRPLLLPLSIFPSMRDFSNESALGLVFADCLELLHLWLQRIYHSYFDIDHLVMSGVESSLVLLEEGVCYDHCVLLGKLLAFALLHFVLQG